MVQKRSEADRAPSAKSSARKETEEMMMRPEDYHYTPAAALVVPQGDPDYVYRWCAEFVNGTPNGAQMQKHQNDGYERVLITDLPEDFHMYDPHDSEGSTRYGGLILMRCPRFKHDARAQYYQRQSRDRLAAANELQGIAGRDTVEEDRGTRALTGEDAARALQTMNQT